MATHAHFVKKARKDYPEQGIKKGDSYWWWAFKFGGGEFKSKTQPRPSQLTRSEFQSTYLGIGEALDDALAAAACKADVEQAVEDAKSSIEELRDEQQSKKDNMPEQLQEADSGQLLQERYDNLDQWYNDLDGVDYSDLEQAEEAKEEKYSKKPKKTNEVGIPKDPDDAVEDLESEQASKQDEFETTLQELKDTTTGMDPGIN